MPAREIAELASPDKRTFTVDPDGYHFDEFSVRHKLTVDGTISSSGLLTLTTDIDGEKLRIDRAASDEAYFAWYNSSGTRIGWLGFGSTSTDHFSITNETDGGQLAFRVADDGTTTDYDRYIIDGDGTHQWLDDTGNETMKLEADGTLKAPGTLLAAGNASTTAQGLTTSDTKFLEQTIACDSASQTLWVHVAGWMRSDDTADNIYLQLRVGVNGSAVNNEVPVVDSHDPTGHTYIYVSQWVSTTADGSGNVKVSLHAKCEGGTETADAMEISYAVFRR